MERPLVLKRRLLAESIRLKFMNRSSSLKNVKDISVKLSTTLNPGYWDRKVESESKGNFQVMEGIVDKSFFRKKDSLIKYQDIRFQQMCAFGRSGSELIKRKVIKSKK